jgi:vacuolar-type H+-ATPase subunit I/STV1
MMPEKPKPSKSSSSQQSDDATLIPFLTQAFSNLFSRLSAVTDELNQLKATIAKIDEMNKSALASVVPKFEEILLNIQKQRRSSVTHLSRLAETITQEFETLNETRSASVDQRVLALLAKTLHSTQQALYCLRLEGFIRRVVELKSELAPPEEKA